MLNYNFSDDSKLNRSLGIGKLNYLWLWYRFDNIVQKSQWRQGRLSQQRTILCSSYHTSPENVQYNVFSYYVFSKISIKINVLFTLSGILLFFDF